MASSLQSPGVQVIEKDASSVVTGASTTVGGTVGVFKWGPVMTPMLINNEDTLVSTFGKPDANTFGSFFCAANFLAYTNAMWVTRASTGNLNAVASGTAVQINNLEVYESSFVDGQANVGPFAARYPGTLGNSITVSIADSGTFSTWPYATLFSGAPGTSDFAAANGATNDEIHIVVIDNNGAITGTAGATLEKYSFVSKAKDAVSYQGLTNYYLNVLLNQSQYIYWMDHPTGATNWGSNAFGISFTSLVDTVNPGYDFTYTLIGGTDDNVPTDGELELAWDLFSDSETYDISLFPVGNVSSTVAKYVTDNVGEARRDAVIFSSLTAPAGGPVFKSSTSRLADATAFKTAIGNSTYTVLDSGFKYMYDKYNDKYRWVALNADIAGLCAKVDATQDTWFSPAGLSKGQIKGAIKLSWSPNQPERDYLYNLAINPVCTFVGQGTLLYGDKTATLKPSAFDRINVRRLFLVLEKSISRAAKYQLFEINDSITRQQFIAMVEPFLRDVQGRRGIDTFKVICDESNNTAQIVDTNQFIGTILVRPARSINFITLNFVAVGSNVSFDVAAQV